MTRFTLDWSNADLCGSNMVTALGQTVGVDVSASAGPADQPWHVTSNAQETALCGTTGAAPAHLAVHFAVPVKGLAFDIVADAHGLSAHETGTAPEVSIVACDPQGNEVPVTIAQVSATVRFVRIAGPVLGLTITLRGALADQPQSLAIGNVTFLAARGANGQAEKGDVDLHSLVGKDVDVIRSDTGTPGADLVTFRDGHSIPFSEIDQIIPCFTPGTGIATPKGEVLVENLKIGDRVLTRDNGIQTINWVGSRQIDYRQLKAIPQFRPIAIKHGALGNGLPERDMLVSPGHRMLIVSEFAQLYFGQSEVLVAAKHMLGMKHVAISPQPYITYIHFMCDNHEIVLSDGTWSESYQPGDFSLKGFDEDQREELFTLFPELATKAGLAAYGAARRTLSKREAKLLFKG